jgi:hypothetical protein
MRAKERKQRKNRKERKEGKGNEKGKERRTKDEVVLRNLTVPNLLRERRIGEVSVGVKTGVEELRGDLLGVLLVRSGDGDDDDLSGGEPEGPIERRKKRRGEGASIRVEKESKKGRETHHFPAKCSVRMAVKRSTEPRIAR